MDLLLFIRKLISTRMLSISINRKNLVRSWRGKNRRIKEIPIAFIPTIYIYIRSALTRVLDRLRASPIPRAFLSFHNFMRLRNLIDRYGWFIGAFYYLFLTISLGISLFPVMVINLSQ